jgi:hypothetical protein
MKKFLKKNTKKTLTCLAIVSFLFLNSCASYKAQPLEDFTEDGTHHSTDSCN